MRIVIDCDEDLLGAAVAVLNGELAPSYKPWRGRYDKLGWGWTHHLSGPHRCFVRRIKDGLSLKQIRPPAENGAADRSREAASASPAPDEPLP
jgi:hypothetical protein